MDAATDSIRAAWPGRVRVTQVTGARGTQQLPRVQLPADESDALIAGLSLAGVGSPQGWIRLVHGAPTAADSAWARDSDRVLLVWPHQGRDIPWPQRASVDAIGGVTSATGTLIARFPRLWRLSGYAVARWSDGEPAAVEHAFGRGCIRDVGVLIDPSSDVTLRQPFRDFVGALLEPCGGARNDGLLSKLRLGLLSGSGSLAPINRLRELSSQSSHWTPWLLLVAAALLTLELAVRRSDQRTA
jgi:hypothetical protein